ncbi:UNVERIFIED_CONTAM: hypothetical protein Slati_2784300 [Sesamum latifolium]|uniref:Zinc finger PMZ-type domain-containing protein n=1 Tax=Sesamum latifolium TaxID=2727402 RepID=A0AAW2VY91_9LAMI
MLNGDEGIRELLRDYKGLSVVPIYFEEKQGPLVVVDTQGNIISTEEQIPSLPFHDQSEPFNLETEINAPVLDETINATDFAFSPSEPANNIDPPHNSEPIHYHNDNSPLFEGEQTNISEEVEGEHGVDEGEGEQGVDEGEGEQVDVERDLEGPLDDDIFKSRPPGHARKIFKTIKVFMREQKRKKRAAEQQRQDDERNMGAKGWFSDASEEDDLVSLRGSDDEEPDYPVWQEKMDMGNEDLTVGMKFPTREKYRDVLRDWAVRRGWDIKFQHNETKKITATCKHGCDWRIHASQGMKTTTFQIKSIKGQHTCAHRTENKQANYKYLGKRIENIIRDNPNEGLISLKNKIMRDIQVDCSLHKVTLVLKVDRSLSPPVLQRMYFYLCGLKEGFLDGCRPIIGLDGCFLKSIYRGQLLTAVGRDVNDNIYPIAMAYVEIEKYDSWEWFINLLLRDIGSPDEKGWAFISDRQKGLLEAVSSLAPNAEHRFCLRHICGMFQLVGYPCCHAIAAINYHRLNVDDYVDTYLKKEMYLKVYSHMINPVPGMHDFEQSTLGKVDPPSVKSKVGRLKKVRRRDPNDIKEIGRMSRKGLTHTCGICLKTGHNKRSCTSLPHPNSRETQHPHVPTDATGTSHAAEMPQSNEGINLNEIPAPNSQNSFSQSEPLFPLDEVPQTSQFMESTQASQSKTTEMPEIFQRLRRSSFTQPTTSMQRPTFVPPRSAQFSSPFQMSPQPEQRSTFSQPPVRNNVQLAPSQMQSTQQPSQRPILYAPRKRKQPAPMSKSAKIKKKAEGSNTSASF